MRRSGRQIARNLANNSPDAACHRLGDWWAEQEAKHRAARNPSAAVAAAEPALRLCARCPLQSACADWAVTFAYTGLAAGATYRHGRRPDADEVADQETPPRLRASRDIIARHLVRTLIHATCADYARSWTQWEAAHNAATSPETRDDAAQPAFALCDHCDALDVCATWAEIDTYTGLAAGAAYRKGSRVDHTLRYGRLERRGINRRTPPTINPGGDDLEAPRPRVASG